MPREMSDKGCREFLDSRPAVDGQATTESVMRCQEICQENNVFEFNQQLYRQVSGSAIGQKQAPPVACLGAGVVERQVFNKPRGIVYDTATGILSKSAVDP